MSRACQQVWLGTLHKDDWQIFSLCKTRMHVTISIYEKYATYMYIVYMQRTQHFELCMTRKRASYAYHTNLWMPATTSWRLFEHFHTRKHAASVGFRHARMNVSAGQVTHTLQFPFWHACFRVVKAGWILVPDPATGHHGRRTSLFRHACMLIRTRKRWHATIVAN